MDESGINRSSVKQFAGLLLVLLVFAIILYSDFRGFGYVNEVNKIKEIGIRGRVEFIERKSRNTVDVSIIDTISSIEYVIWFNNYSGFKDSSKILPGDHVRKEPGSSIFVILRRRGNALEPISCCIHPDSRWFMYRK